MTDSRIRVTFGRTFMPGLFIASLSAGAFVSLTDSAAAKVRAERMSYGICEALRKDPPDPALLADLRARPDFAQIVDFVETNCGGLIDTLVGPTNTITGNTPDNSRSGNRELPDTDTPDEEPEKPDPEPEPEPDPEPETPPEK